MGIRGLRPPLFPRHIPGFSHCEHPLHFQKRFPQLGLEAGCRFIWAAWLPVHLPVQKCTCKAVGLLRKAFLQLHGQEQELPTTSTLTRASGDTSPAPKLLSNLCPASPNPTAVPSRAQLWLIPGHQSHQVHQPQHLSQLNIGMFDTQHTQSSPPVVELHYSYQIQPWCCCWND